MPSQVVRHLAAAGGVTDMHGILQVEMRCKSRKIGGIMIHVVTVARLRGPAVAAAVMGDDAIAVTQEEQHLRVPVICRQRPSMAEHDGLTLSPVLVEDLNAVLGRDRRHSIISLLDVFGLLCAACAADANVRGGDYLRRNSACGAADSVCGESNCFLRAARWCDSDR